MVLAAAHFNFWEVQDISTTPKIISSLGKSNKIVFNLTLSCSDFPNLSYVLFFFHIIFPSFPSKELFFGKRLVLIDCSIVSSLRANWMVLAAVHFEFWEVQGISNTPRIISYNIMSPLGKSHKMVFNLVLCYVFPSFSHIPFISLQRTLFGKRSVLIDFSCFSSFWASWMVLAAAHFGFFRSAGYLQYP